MKRRSFIAGAIMMTACGGEIFVAPFDADAGPGSCAEESCPDASLPDVSSPAHDAGTTEPSLDASPLDASAGDASLDDASIDGGRCAGAPGSRFVTSVVDHQFGTGQNYNQTTGFPAVLYGPPAAGNASSVVSLGNGGWVVLAFAGNAIVDEPGPDFIVFENPLPQFKELATVAVSEDGVAWTSFPCTWQRGDSDYGSCAGVNPVLSSPTNGIDPSDPAVAGGDAFDLADLGVSRARYVRITDRPDLDGADGVFDLDAVAIVHPECP